MELTGTIENIIYRNADNGYTVLELFSDEGEHITAVGSLALCNRGERVTLTGQYASHPKYGRQFKAASAKTLAPSTLSAIESYLGSGLIRGVGASTAHAIVQSFGMNTLDILDNAPERLLEISGIGKKRAAMIAASYQENMQMRDIMLALEPYGVTVTQALKLYRIYGGLCLARIEENPYQMIADVEGIGFVIADRIAQNVPGFSYDSASRLSAGILYALNLARMEYGHTYVPRASLISYAVKLLGVDEEAVSDTLDALIGKGELVYQMVGDDDGIFLPWVQRMEQGVAEKLIQLTEKPIANPFLNLALTQNHSIQLAPQQYEAVEAALNEGLLVITGGPGTGKTTIIRCITEILSDMQMDFALAAPTGRAAKRMTEATGCEAKTIHRLLEYIPGEGFTRNDENPLFYDIVIIDEASMVDIPLMSALLKAIVPGTRLILVGDSDQLPPVGCGDALRDIIKSDVVRVVRLTEIFRQAQESYIVQNAHLVNHGEMPRLDLADSDFRFEELASQDAVLARLIALCTHPAPVLHTNEPLLDIQVLTPMKKGTLGVYNINRALQAALNPPAPGKREQAFGDTVFREGDKIMQMQNDYKVEWTRRGQSGEVVEGTGAFNGDLGTVYRIDPAARRLSVLFDDDRLANYDFSQVDTLSLAYCISIHKSQGSEFPIVLLPLAGGTPLLLTRNLLYTAITRAKSQVCCIGRRETIRAMVDNNRSTRRYTSLAQRLAECAFLKA
ncbi:MAG: ATP-dependent RecD-like DNA helicase [Clostridium sp.]|nr:ATP-dependent RecD-like DNA helicase [Clostridium sp.]MDD7140243.1 ATP-dependent RecD-like DNA helicase [Clostridium sp.]MDY6080815.1 ATP-dependent RecD-like DNA helicase [Eubacteriales bacterium]